MPPLMMWTVASPLGGATPIMPITRTGMLTSVVDGPSTLPIKDRDR